MRDANGKRPVKGTLVGSDRGALLRGRCARESMISRADFDVAGREAPYGSGSATGRPVS